MKAKADPASRRARREGGMTVTQEGGSEEGAADGPELPEGCSATGIAHRAEHRRSLGGGATRMAKKKSFQAIHMGVYFCP